MNQLLIREATETDIPSIYQLGRKWAEENITYGLRPSGEAEIRVALGPYFLVAEIEGQVVGFISGSSRVSDGMAVVLEGVEYLEIDELYVAPEHRGKGIGSGLVEKVIEKAREKGLKKALVYSASKDVYNVLRFYEGQGFGSWYVQMFREL